VLSTERARAAGLLATPLTIGAILAATAVSPTFSWTGSALSDLGVAAGTATLFNGGLILGGLLGLAYAVALVRSTEGVAGAALVAAYVAALLGLAGVGLFPSGRRLHFPAAATFYLGGTAAMVADGAARPRTRAGAAALTAAGLHLLGWALWLRGVRPGPGLALPELWGALLFGAWLLVASPAAPLAPSDPLTGPTGPDDG